MDSSESRLAIWRRSRPSPRRSSFSRAAERLGYAQSAVSQQIAALERAVGLKLVERPGGPRPVSLTEAGEIVLRHADRLLARLGALRADLDQLVAGESGTIRVGTFQSAGARILPGVVREFRARWPEVRVEIREELDESAPARRRGRGRARPDVRLGRRPRAAAARQRDAARGPLRAAHAARQPLPRARERDAAGARRSRRDRAAGRRVVRAHARARLGGGRRGAPHRLPHGRQPDGHAHGRRGHRARARARARGGAGT